MSEDNGRHVRPEDCPPHLELAAICCPRGAYDAEHARGRLDGAAIPITVEGARRQVHERELELAYARGVLVARGAHVWEETHA